MPGVPQKWLFTSCGDWGIFSFLIKLYLKASPVKKKIKMYKRSPNTYQRPKVPYPVSKKTQKVTLVLSSFRKGTMGHPSAGKSSNCNTALCKKTKGKHVKICIIFVSG